MRKSPPGAFAKGLFVAGMCCYGIGVVVHRRCAREEARDTDPGGDPAPNPGEDPGLGPGTSLG